MKKTEKMEARELRIGNIIRYRDIEEVRTELRGQIRVVTGDDIASMSEIDIYCEVVIPEPITEEWLKRFGFRNSGGYWYPPETKYGFFTHLKFNAYGCEGRWGFCQDYDREIYQPIDFIHEIQNLYFCLDKKELTLKTQ